MNIRQPFVTALCDWSLAQLLLMTMLGGLYQFHLPSGKIQRRACHLPMITQAGSDRVRFEPRFPGSKNLFCSSVSGRPDGCVFLIMHLH
jgi:hypothetical protein